MTQNLNESMNFFPEAKNIRKLLLTLTLTGRT